MPERPRSTLLTGKKAERVRKRIGAVGLERALKDLCYLIDHHVTLERPITDTGLRRLV